MRRSLAALALAVVAVGAGTAHAATATSSLPVRATVGTPRFSSESLGYTPTQSARTIPFWTGSFTDPTNGVTYPYAMVGKADPRIGHGGGTTTVPTVIIPLRLSFASAGGYTLDGTADAAKIAASPVFQPADYLPAINSNSSGVQLEDATMRSQFNEVGASPYHLNLGAPTTLPTVSIAVSKNQGLAVQTSAGVPVGLVDINWFSSRLHQLLGQLGVPPTALPIFVTDNSYLYFGTPDNCCVLGYHGAHSPTGGGAGSTKSSGAAKINTFIYTAYIRPGVFAEPAIADIHALSHEVAEWGDDPFTNNWVNPWLTPTAPQYGCTNILETGDPVVGIGFKLPGNSYDGAIGGDGSWHPEDEVFLPWFARESPNLTSEGGRYTLMGALNPYPGFQVPASGCS